MRRTSAGQLTFSTRRARRRRRRRFETLEPRQLLTGVTYQGGPLIDHAAVETVYLGSAWTNDTALAQNANRLDQFFANLTQSTYMDMLAEYGTPQGGAIGRGQFTGRLNVPEDDWVGGVLTDATIQRRLNSELVSRAIPASDGNQLLVVFTPPNVSITEGGLSSDGSPVGFAGYHSHFVDAQGATVYYAVIPNPVGNDRVPGISTDDQQTVSASHELAEAVTDPTGNSWWDDSGDAHTGLEIADFANPSTDVVYLGPYAVEKVWSNRLGGLEAPAGATATPQTGSPGSTSPGSTSPGDNPTAKYGEIPPTLGDVAVAFTHVLGYYGEVIEHDYQQFVGRSPDTAGLNYWVAQMQAGLTEEQVSAAFLGSPEYARLHGGSDAGWVTGMYHDLLGRMPDAAGLRYWTEQLASGQTHFQVALGFATSAEREAIVVNNDFQQFLSRPATATELAYWTAALTSGHKRDELVAALIGSAEFYHSNAGGAKAAALWVDHVYADLFNLSPETGEANYWVSQVDG